MKKYITSVLLLILISGYNYAQSGWFWQNPLPQGNDLYCIRYINNNTGFASGGCGTVLRTTNNGGDWQIIKTDSGFISTALYFQNINTGCVLSTEDITHTISYRSSKVIKTTNGGITWHNKILMGSTYTHSMEFVSSDTGFFTVKVSGGGYIFKTTNAGENWNSIFYQPNYYVYNTHFRNNSTGYSCGSIGINKTTNGGLNWQNQYSFSSMGGHINSITFLNSNTGIAVGTRNSYPSAYQIILRTTNAGNNWIEIPGSGNNTLLDIRVADNNTIYVSGSNILLKTTNVGINWTSIPLTDNLMYRSIDFNSSNGIIAGNLGIVLNTTNNGEDWLNYYPSYRGGGISSIKFLGRNLGFAAAQYNILKTTNGGLNWSLLVTPSNRPLSSLFIVDENVVYAGGGQSNPISVLIKTTNGGINWVSQNPNISTFLGSIFFVNDNTGWCCGSGTVSKTTNGGLNWTATSLAGALKSIVFVNNATGYVVGYVNGYKTTNSGDSWQPLPQEAVNLATSVYFIDANTGFTTNYHMQIRKTTNAGLNWVIQTDAGNGSWYFNSIHFIDNLTGYAVGDFGTIMKTTNTGDTWIYLKSPTNNFLSSVFMTDTNECYIGGNGSTILKTTNGGGVIGLQSTNTEVPQRFILSQNYPNPFNPQTKIKFDVPKASFTKLIIYDLLGREVATLVDEELRPGTYEADWDASSFSSGVYFYRIISDEFVETKKMVLMK